MTLYPETSVFYFKEVDYREMQDTLSGPFISWVLFETPKQIITIYLYNN